jgi:hypothetical protein
MAKPFDRQTLEAAFLDIGNRARAEGRIVDIAIYGGSVLILTLNHRATTRDVDAVFIARVPACDEVHGDARVRR